MSIYKSRTTYEANYKESWTINESRPIHRVSTIYESHTIYEYVWVTNCIWGELYTSRELYMSHDLCIGSRLYSVRDPLYIWSIWVTHYIWVYMSHELHMRRTIYESRTTCESRLIHKVTTIFRSSSFIYIDYMSHELIYIRVTLSTSLMDVCREASYAWVRTINESRTIYESNTIYESWMCVEKKTFLTSLPENLPPSNRKRYHGKI